MLVNLESPQYQMIGGPDINSMKFVGCLHRPNGQVEATSKLRVNDALPFKLDTSIGCSTMLCRMISIILSIDNGMMFEEEPRWNIVCLNSTLWITACLCCCILLLFYLSVAVIYILSYNFMIFGVLVLFGHALI